MKNRKNKKGFTLIELLVVIAIIAILAVVVILTLNPAELLRQARDSNRISDFATIKSSLGLFEADVSTSSLAALGSYGWLYTNSASGALLASSTFSGGSTTAEWGYAATSIASGVNTSTALGNSSSSRLVNGTGWIPTNLSAISSGAPIGAWPQDPINNASFTYTFVASGTVYKLAAKIESYKYGYLGPNDVVSTDGGNSTSTYEQGTNLAL